MKKAIQYGMPESRADDRLEQTDSLCRGVVVRYAEAVGAGARFEIEIDGRRVLAAQAESCVLAPEVSDVVLVACARAATSLMAGPTLGSYVLAVLERRGEKPRVWQAPGERPLALAADRLELVGRKALAARAPELELVAEKATLALRVLNLAGEVVNAATDKLSWVGRTLQSVAQWSAHRAGTYTRSVAETDSVEAQHLSRRAQGTFTSSSTHTILTAKEDVRVDGQRIFVG